MLTKNTKVTKTSLYWCFTSYSFSDIENLRNTSYKTITYWVFGVEICPTTKKEHFQGYIEFSRSQPMDYVKKVFKSDSIHVEQRGKYSTSLQASNYCKKGEQTHQEWTEEGIEGPNFGKNAIIEEWGVISPPSEQGARKDICKIRTEIIEGDGDIRKLLEEGSIENYQQLKFAEGLLKYRRPVTRDAPHVIVKYGAPGSGKTRSIMDQYPDVFRVEPDCKWFDGYVGQTVVLFDDYRSNMSWSYLLQVIDRYPIKLPVKGSFVEWKPNVIFFTSHHHPRLWYKNRSENIDQLLRRISLIEHYTGSEVIASEPRLGETQDQWEVEESFSVPYKSLPLPDV